MSFAALTLALAITAVNEPKANERCYGSLGLLTGNITSNPRLINAASTSVINVWAFLDLAAPGSPPVAWLYKNKSQQRFVAFNDYHPDLVNRVTSKARIVAHVNNRGIHTLVPVDDHDLVAMEDALLSQGYARVACFTRDISQ